MKQFERLLHSIDRKYRKFTDARFNKLQPQDTPLGFKLMGNEAMEQGLFEPEETFLVRKLLDKAEHFVNVGANIGYYCCLALQKNIPVIAFEPESQNVKFLLKNIQANNWDDQIEIYPVALSDSIGIVDIYGGGTGASLLKGWAGTPSNLAASIPTSTLDLIVGDRLNNLRTLVVIDIEGAEFYALKGALRIIQQSPKPIWMIEICVHEHQPQGVPINPNLLSTFSVFWDNGYDAYTASMNPRLVTREELEAIVNSGADTINTYNFIFVENGYDLLSGVL